MPEKYFESLTSLTNQLDVESLQKSYLAILADLFPISYAGNFLPENRNGKLMVRENLSLYRKGDEQYIKTLRNFELGPSEPMLERCTQDWRPKYVCEEYGPMLCYLPVKYDNKLHSIIKLVSDKLCVAQVEHLLHINRIYSNFLKILMTSTHDNLTGLMNRSTLELQFRKLIQQQVAIQQEQSDQFQEINKRHHRGNTAVCLALIDIDHFKKINDNFGHLFGDEILLLVSQMLQESFRHNDFLFRYGGEEFLVILEPTFQGDIHGVLDRFRQKMEDKVFPQVGKVTVSIGYSLVTTMDHCATYIGQADSALYYAKENGRNGVFGFNTLMETGMLHATATNSSIELF